MSDNKVPLTAKDVAELYASAVKNGTLIAWARLALEWMGHAEAEIVRLCADAPPATRPTVPSAALPGFAELEAAGARIGRIRIVPMNVFDTEDPDEDNALFRLANRLHVTTQPKVIERAL